ncbi:uncharacterized protein LOC131955767 [Physella acuta]|uniref:uncharacterized protein LOC131955767 n=1 Tax=Physella acuta TaxID=109671 RepID=UPI0027DDE98E|nr:uncharacterized protein LOC131955767 [Physella acuta]
MASWDRCDLDLLHVDETKRPRANSDPVGLPARLPEITVTCEDGREDPWAGQLDHHWIPPSPRRRANTCPEDMFLARRGRPPTPPPADVSRGATGKRFSLSRDLTGFSHHRLTKVAEDVPVIGRADKGRRKADKGRPRADILEEQATRQEEQTNTQTDIVISSELKTDTRRGNNSVIDKCVTSII